MTFAGPLDLILTALLAMRRLGVRRTIVGAFFLTPLYLYSLPPVACSCLPTLFRRCIYGRAYLAAARSDLKNLASQQEIYYSDHFEYSSDPTALTFVHSDGVRVTIRSWERGWSATATHAALDDGRGCALWYGEPPADELGLDELGAPGELTCTD